MAIEKLNIEEKVQNQGATTAGRLMASDFNAVTSKINELVEEANKHQDTIDKLPPIEVASEEAMAELIAAGEVDENRMYFVPETDE